MAVGGVAGEVTDGAASASAVSARAGTAETDHGPTADEQASPSGPDSPETDEEPEHLEVRIVSTSNQMDEEPFLPMRTIVTLFRIQARAIEPSARACRPHGLTARPSARR